MAAMARCTGTPRCSIGAGTGCSASSSGPSDARNIAEKTFEKDASEQRHPTHGG